ncbi:MAG: VOC family protein, partial [Pseudomonadota bacterium]
MTSPVTGLHHVTAIASDPQANLDFYAKALGLRFVKKTVNFDAPEVYHLYYGDEAGAAGTVMTFFPFPRAARGQAGAGQAVLTQFAVPPGALPFWDARLPGMGAQRVAKETVFGAPRTVWQDPDGLLFALVEGPDARAPWTGAGIEADVAIRGFLGVTLAVRDGTGISAILEDIFGYLRGAEVPLGAGTLTRFVKDGPAGIVDLHVDPALPEGIEGAGSVHHVAFSVPDRAAQAEVQAALAATGLRVTPQIDRDYFWAIYSRVPGDILFEVATEEPGFTADEPLAELGTALRLPTQHEGKRARLESLLP